MITSTNIPEGPYCYTSLGVEMTDRGPVIKIKKCPYWEYVGPQRARCNFLKVDDDDEDACGLLWDQVKECGINEGDDYE